MGGGRQTESRWGCRRRQRTKEHIPLQAKKNWVWSCVQGEQAPGWKSSPRPQRGGGWTELRLTYTWSQSHVEGIDAGQSKVGDLDLSAAADQNVVGLQVAVHHHVSVQEVQPPQQLLHHVLRPGQKRWRYSSHWGSLFWKNMALKSNVLSSVVPWSMKGLLSIKMQKSHDKNLCRVVAKKKKINEHLTGLDWKRSGIRFFSFFFFVLQ